MENIGHVIVFSQSSHVRAAMDEAASAAGAHKITMVSTSSELQKELLYGESIHFALVDLDGDSDVVFDPTAGLLVERPLAAVATATLRDPHTVEKCRNEGWLEVVVKPFHTETLVAAIRTAYWPSLFQERKGTLESTFHRALDSDLIPVARALAVGFLSRHPFSESWMCHYAEVLIKTRHMREAEFVLRKILKIHPEYLQAVTDLSRLLMATGRTDEAQRILKEQEERLERKGESLLEAAEESSPYQKVKNLNDRATELARKKLWHEALLLYRQAIDNPASKPIRHILFFNMSLSCEKLQQWEEGKMALRQAIRIKGESYTKAVQKLQELEAKQNKKKR